MNSQMKDMACSAKNGLIFKLMIAIIMIVVSCLMIKAAHNDGNDCPSKSWALGVGYTFLVLNIIVILIVAWIWYKLSQMC
jgi:hypothetical protein